MRRLRAAARLVRCVVHGLHGLWITLVRLPAATKAERHAAIRWWSIKMLRLIGIGLHVEGAPLDAGHLLVVNHVSWLDIMVVHAVVPQARFVSKADVQSWPLVARLVDAGGTLYLERERKRDALRVVHAMAEALRAGDTVAIFPEGTTSTGHGLLPFHANLLQAAISVGAPIQPAALRFSDSSHAVSQAIEFVGDTTLLQSLWRSACGDGVRASLTLLPPRSSAGADRREMASRLRADIGAALGLDQPPDA